MSSLHVTVDDVLSHIKKESSSAHSQGIAFENLMKWWLLEDAVQKVQFKNVTSYSEWSGSRGESKQDTGIDLVAESPEGEFTAIQCKFYDPEGLYRIQRQDIDSFITDSSRSAFVSRIVIETTDKEWGEHAEKALYNQEKETQRISLAALRASSAHWAEATKKGMCKKTPVKTLRPHQKKAFDAVTQAFESQTDRGMLVMACGTGKTLTALRIAEHMAGPQGHVLVLTPSLSLVNQTIHSWHHDTQLSLRSFAVCSDRSVGTRKSEDLLEIKKSDLVIPATVDAQHLSQKLGSIRDPKAMCVIFATYHSIHVISEAQKKHQLPDFDLIIADEAHRTTGSNLLETDSTHFVKVHDQDFLKGRKRLYMTATPRIYSDSAKSSADQRDTTLASMDDPKLYGKVLYNYSFAQAIRDGLLSDYQIIILHLPDREAIQVTNHNRGHEVNLSDTAKIIGCWKALNKMGISSKEYAKPLKKVLAFTNSIDASERLTEHFSSVITEYQSMKYAEKEAYEALPVALKHVDGRQSSLMRSQTLQWLAEEDSEECRIVSNVRCLSEGVDVPALDGLVFFHPKKNQQEVVQAVGRVMRKAPGKDKGFIILPVVTSDTSQSRQVLEKNKPFEVVVQVVNALRSHDERLNAQIHASSLDPNVSMDLLEVVSGIQIHKVDDLPSAESARLKIGEYIDRPQEASDSLSQEDFSQAHVIHKLIQSTLVKHCARKAYWPEWAEDVGKMARSTIARIQGLIEDQPPMREVFESFLAELRDDLNPAISEAEAIEMLAQHLVTQPIFEALFSQKGFTAKNPVSQSLDRVLEQLKSVNLESETRDLGDFYASVSERAQSLSTAKAKQKLIKELYDQFFRRAFPLTTERLGIAYTPPEIVDFILRSVDTLLQEEFDSSLSHEGVTVLDPFTGTGTFIARLLGLDLIDKKDLKRKYTEELWANDLVLLAYYVAAVNIENVYAESSGSEYLPFPGICLTDTFALDHEDRLKEILRLNSERRVRQQATDIRVVIGNPPYSAGQKNENDNAKNVKYPGLDQRIKESYVAHSTSTNNNSLYDSYLRAIRWATDRIAESKKDQAGVVGFITNASWIRGLSARGVRKSIAEEFSKVYVLDLRGDQRTSGEKSRQEGGKIFGQASRTPTAITLFVKNPKKQAPAKTAEIFYHNIGDYLSREQKLTAVENFGHLSGVPWIPITADAEGDWLEKGDPSFAQLIKIGDKKTKKA